MENKNEMRKLIDQVKNFGKSSLNEESKGLWANINAKKKRGESPAKPSDDDYPDKKQWKKLTKEEDETARETKNYMFWQNLKTINDATSELLRMDKSVVDSMVADGHAWVVDHVSTSSDDIEEVYHFFEANLSSKKNKTS